MIDSNRFSQKVIVFHGRELPEQSNLVGYSLIIEAIYAQEGILLPIPEVIAVCTDKHKRYNTEFCQVFTLRHKPKDDLMSHLIFAIKYEGVDLLITKKLFQMVGKEPILKLIDNEPTSQYTRKIWFLYEWLLGVTLDVPDLKIGSYVELVNPKYQFVGANINSLRHRIKNNLPGVREYCPMIRRSQYLESLISKNLSEQIEEGLSKKDKELVRRTSAFLLLKDSKASFAIEGENPPSVRARNWGKIIGQAGKVKLSINEIIRLQDIVIGTRKLKTMGLRVEGGFIGEHDRDTFSPMPDHISANPSDLDSLLRGLFTTSNLLSSSGYDPVLLATTLAFGFVFIHPLSDGNGRIHRYIIHHTLAERGYTKRDMIFPISSAILNRISDYNDILESYSHPRLDLIKWEETETHNIKVLNDTSDLYRYFDLTKQAEFLFECVAETISSIIPAELDYINKYDRLFRLVDESVSLPDTRIDLLIKYLDQNSGVLSKKKRQKEFIELDDAEVDALEAHYREVFLT